MVYLREKYFRSILFLIFINDLPNNIQSFVQIFADDCKLYNISSNKDIIQNDIEILQSWSGKWQLYFNFSKCKVINFGKNNPENKLLCHVSSKQKVYNKQM